MSTTFSQRDDGVSDNWDGPSDVAAAVAEFHMAFNLPIRQLPSNEIDHALARLRVALLEEEVGEFVAASENGDLVGIADALADIVYEGYAKLSLKKYRPIAARNDDKKVFSGLL